MAQIDILNGALALLGENAVTANDGSKAWTTFSALWNESILAYVLGRYPWTALKKRVVLSQPSLTVTAASGDGTTVTLTVGAHSLQVGQTVYVSGIDPTVYNNTYALTAVTSTTISFTSPITSAYVSGGTVTWAPLFDFSYVYSLPSDCLRAIKVNGYNVSRFYEFSTTAYLGIGNVAPPFKIEGRYLLSDEDSVMLQYTSWDGTNYTPPTDPTLVSLLEHRTASLLAMPLTRGLNLKKTMQDDYRLAFLEAKHTDSQQGTPDEEPADSWLTSRY